jgi:gamma-glutamyltranspeptidase / glutathione hydrolase
VFRDFQRPGRSAVYGTRAMIATSHPEASRLGIEVLRRGGSAVDAAIAASAMLCVVEPAMTGLGGDCFAIVARPNDPPVTLNGSGRSPAGATLDYAARFGISSIADNSPLAVTIPGAVDAWCRLHRDYGRLDLAELLEPAACRAEEGYPVAPRVAFDWSRNAERLNRHPATAACFLPAGRPPSIGDIHRQPALASTLRAIAARGRAGFYQGEVAEDIVTTLREIGGCHTLEDFAHQDSIYEPPISTSFAGVDVLECPPNGQGATALLMLRALEGWEAFEVADALERNRLFAEATMAAYALRDHTIADPERMEMCAEDLLSDRAIAFVRGGGACGKPWREPDLFPWESDTICLSVVDENGMVVSFINSLFNAFGSTILAPRSGVMLHCRGTSFQLNARHPNGLSPRKRPMHTIIPGLVLRGGQPLMPFGVMGGHYQAAGHAHFLLRLFKERYDLQGAIDAPRLFGYKGLIQVEAGYGEASAEHLERRGHRVERMTAPIGGAQAVWIDRDRGILIGGSDPRKDGCALGY